MFDQTWHDFRIHFNEACTEDEEFESSNVSKCASNAIHKKASEHAAIAQAQEILTHDLQE